MAARDVARVPNQCPNVSDEVRSTERGRRRKARRRASFRHVLPGPATRPSRRLVPGSSPGGPNLTRMAKPIWLGCAGQVCRVCPKCSCAAHLRAHLERTCPERPLGSARRVRHAHLGPGAVREILCDGEFETPPDPQSEGLRVGPDAIAGANQCVTRSYGPERKPVCPLQAAPGCGVASGSGGLLGFSALGSAIPSLTSCP